MVAAIVVVVVVVVVAFSREGIKSRESERRKRNYE